MYLVVSFTHILHEFFLWPCTHSVHLAAKAIIANQTLICSRETGGLIRTRRKHNCHKWSAAIASGTKLKNTMSGESKAASLPTTIEAVAGEEADDTVAVPNCLENRSDDCW